MKSVFRATTPNDRAQLSELLANAFDAHSEAGSLLNPAVMAWKYWEARADWTEPRSYVLDRDGRIVAHAGIWPLIYPGDHGIRGVQMIDWCAVPDSPGIGLTLVQKLSSMFDFMYSIGGSDLTMKALPAFGFRQAAQVWTAARPVRPLRQMFTHQNIDWKLGPRFVRNLGWAKRPGMRELSGWKTSLLRPREIPAGLIDMSSKSKFAPRSPAFFDYLLQCPSVKYQLHGISSDRGLEGYFAIGAVRGQARIAGVWLRTPVEENWRVAYILAQQTAREFEQANEIIARGSVGASGRGAEAAGMRIMKQTPVFFLDKKGKFALPNDFQFQLSDDDSAFLDTGQTSYYT